MPSKPGSKNSDQNNALFIDDFFKKDMLFGAICRAPVPRGSIKGIVVPDFIEKEFTVCRYETIPGDKEISFYGSRIPVLLHSEIRYLGEPFFLLAGPDEHLVNDAVNHVDIRYERGDSFYFSPGSPEVPESQVMLEKRYEQGNVEKTLNRAHQVVEGSYFTGTQHPRYSDPQGAFVIPGKDAITVYSPTQWPFHVRSSVAGVLGIPEDSVIVKVPRISTHLDGKIWYPSLIASHAALLARQSNKAVRIIVPPADDLIYGPRRAPVLIKHSTGIDKNGSILAMDIGITVDAGAYPILSEEMLLRIMSCSIGPYPCDHVRILGRVIRTNNPPSGTFTGFGLSQAFFALEMHANRLAELSDNEPYSWKRSQVLKRMLKHEHTGKSRKKESFVRTMDDAVKQSDFLRKHSAYEMMKKRREEIHKEETVLRGIGLSYCYQLGGLLMHGEDPDTYSISIRLDDNERLHIYTSGIPGSKGTEMLWKHTAGSILAIEPENIIIEEIDSSRVPDSGPSILSHNIFIIARLIERACQGIQKKRFRSPLPIELQRSIRSSSQNDFNVADLFSSPFPVTWASSVLELEVNPYSYEIKIRGIWISVDCGEVINPQAAESTIESGVLHSLEWLEYAQKTKKSTAGYSPFITLPYQVRVPPVFVSFLEQDRKNPPSGVGELASSLVPAAYSTALAQATGYYIDTIPFEPDKIFGYTEG